MPAVNLTQLQNEIKDLLLNFSNSEKFNKHLNAIMEKYANRVYRVSLIAAAKASGQAYHLPPLVLLYLEKNLQSAVNAHSQDIVLENIKLMLNDPHFESQKLAASMLGRLPVASEEQIIETVLVWLENQPNRAVLDCIFNEGLRNLRENTPSDLLLMLKKLTPADQSYELTAFCRAMISLVKDTNFQNTPGIFSILSEMILSGKQLPERDYQELVLALFDRASSESLYFFRQLITIGMPEVLVRSTRRIINELPENIQTEMKNLLINS